MSPNRPCFSPADSDDLFDSLTGDLIYSPKNLFSLIPMRKQIEFKTSRSYLFFRWSNKNKYSSPPSPEFLPNAYYRSPPEDMSKYRDFEDFVQKKI